MWEDCECKMKPLPSHVSAACNASTVCLIFVGSRNSTCKKRSHGGSSSPSLSIAVEAVDLDGKRRRLLPLPLTVSLSLALAFSIVNLQTGSEFRTGDWTEPDRGFKWRCREGRRPPFLSTSLACRPSEKSAPCGSPVRRASSFHPSTLGNDSRF